MQHCVPPAHLARTGGFDVDLCDLAILDEHGIALGAHAEAAVAQVLFQAEPMRELSEPSREPSERCL